MLFYQDSENFFEFIVHICAIVGGIFTVAGIIDAMIHRSVSVLFKKRIGKLSWLSYTLMDFMIHLLIVLTSSTLIYILYLINLFKNITSKLIMNAF